MGDSTASGRLPAATRLGAVRLNAADPARLAGFYRQALGLVPHRRQGETLVLGAGGEDLLELAPPRNPGAPGRFAGLYHFCLAVEKREALGWLLKRLLDHRVPLQGLVDHHMAEALYLADPEGNGVELNWDRPRDQWKPFSVWAEQGNAPLDAEGLLELAGEKPLKALPTDTRVGHVHLHVPALGPCRDFYCGVLGFDKVFELPGQAVFTSAGGYHHHVAFNVWKGPGLSQALEGSPGLDHFTVLLPGAGDLERVLQRVRAAGIPSAEDGAGRLLKDPAGNGVRLAAPA